MFWSPIYNNEQYFSIKIFQQYAKERSQFDLTFL